MDHLDAAKRCAERGQEHSAIPELARYAMQRATMHALIDIAESLHAVQKPLYQDALLPMSSLADLPLEHVGGVDDDDDDGQICSDCSAQPKCCLQIHAESESEGGYV